MTEIIKELFLDNYFMFEAVLGRYLVENEKLFFALGGIYLIEESELNELFLSANDKNLKEIRSERDFLQYQRIKNYSLITGLKLAIDDKTDEFINIKGSAITNARKYKLKSETEAAKNVLYEIISNEANSGCIPAMFILGILQCEGIFVERNALAGIKTLSKAADWNDISSIAALLKYDEDSVLYNLSRLYTVVENTPFSALYDKAREAYPKLGVKQIKEVKLLENSFNSGILKRELYDRKCARIIHGYALNFRCKESVLFNLNAESIPEISKLPLKLAYGNSGNVNFSSFGKIHLHREEEQQLIRRNLVNSDLRTSTLYRPLCICSDSLYLLNMYAAAITDSLKDFHTERIEISELTGYDIEPNGNNVFVRSVNEDADNCFLMFFTGYIDESVIDSLKGFLQSGRRAKFHLSRPNVTLDLSAVLPVCFCDMKNLKYFKPYCDVVQLADVSAKELPAAIKFIISKKKQFYGLKDIKLKEKNCEIFKNFSIDTVELILDEAIRECRLKTDIPELKRENLLPYISNYSRNKIGFGGSKNEIA